MLNRFSRVVAHFLEKQMKDLLEKQLLPKIEDILFSERFARHIQEHLKQAVYECEADQTVHFSSVFSKERKIASFRMIAEEFLHEKAEVVTSSGVLQGVIIEVKEDYMRLREASDAIVLLPFTSISSIRKP